MSKDVSFPNQDKQEGWSLPSLGNLMSTVLRFRERGDGDDEESPSDTRVSDSQNQLPAEPQDSSKLAEEKDELEDELEDEPGVSVLAMLMRYFTQHQIDRQT
ncbi:hypothetical protein VKT23_011434 [Stygiomarasmius scandens]|uniref:Uncharacterized protein n=1 Tax=Marasmiellus scandens TaxID=2682957 RepID=A0ABR1JC29_9AGAR